jgi:hypothetical protein
LTFGFKSEETFLTIFVFVQNEDGLFRFVLTDDDGDLHQRFLNNLGKILLYRRGDSVMIEENIHDSLSRFKHRIYSLKNLDHPEYDTFDDE